VEGSDEQQEQKQTNKNQPGFYKIHPTNKGTQAEKKRNGGARERTEILTTALFEEEDYLPSVA